MPKVIVLISGAERRVAVLADAVAHGAAHVRYTEVDVRAISSASGANGQTRELGRDEQLRDYDGVVFSISSPPDADTALNDFLDAAERDALSGAFLNSVFAIIGSDDPVSVARVARLGGIVVTVPHTSSDPLQHARMLGERVATVVEWVRHARSHEHGHSHHHG